MERCVCSGTGSAGESFCMAVVGENVFIVIFKQYRSPATFVVSYT